MAVIEKSSMPNPKDEKTSLSSMAKENRKILKEKLEIEKKLSKERLKLSAKEIKELEAYKLSLEEKIAAKQKEFDSEREARRREALDENFESLNKLKEDWTLTVDDKGISHLGEALSAGIESLTSAIDKTIDKFLDTQESMAYNLNGTGVTINKLNESLSKALAGTGIVKQEEVYNHLSELVRNGIIYNVEQRAFLATLSEDLGMMFDATDGSLVRLINLQRKDLTDERMAIQSSLKTFLNQNYETSQYIVQSFQTVSSSLLEAQSFMGAQASMQLEATVQQWLGSLSSVGMSEETISSLARALGELGSGNISALSSSNMQNLLVMGAARSGQSYATLLTDGLTAKTANDLMQGIVSYIASMGSSDSNVVRSEYARIFGLNVSDIRAAMQVGNIGLESPLSTDINSLLSKTDSYVRTTQQINNLLENFMYQWSTHIADDPINYGLYKLGEIAGGIGQMIGKGITLDIGFLGTGTSINLGEVLGLAPLIGMFQPMLETLNETISGGLENIGKKLITGTSISQSIFDKLGMNNFSRTSLFDVSSWGNLFLDPDSQYIKVKGTFSGYGEDSTKESNRRQSGEPTQVPSPADLVRSFGDSLKSILGNEPDMTEVNGKRIELASSPRGNLSTRDTGEIGPSGSMIVANTSRTDLVNSAMLSSAELTQDTIMAEQEIYDVNDLYKELFSDTRWGSTSFQEIAGINLDTNNYLKDNWGTISNIYSFLSDDLPKILKEELPEILASQPYGTYTKIAEASNTVTIGNDLSTAFDLMLLSTVGIQNIYGLLMAKFTESGTFSPISFDDSGWEWNSALTWLTNPSSTVTSGGGI